MNAVVFCDIDGTIVHSRRHLADADPADVTIVDEVDGRACGYATTAALDLLREVAGRALWVPTTTRTLGQLRRLRLPVDVSTAIVSNGYRIVVHGVEDREWSRERLAEVADTCAPLTEVLEALKPVTTLEGLRVRVPDDVLVSVAAPDHLAPEAVEALMAVATGFGWRVAPGERVATLVPAVLTKVAAAQEVAERRGPCRTLACGNDVFDLDLVAWADWGAFRTEQGGHGPPGAAEIDVPGLEGAERLLRALLANLDTDVAGMTGSGGHE